MPEQVQARIRSLFESSVSDLMLLYEYNLFNISVAQKLWSSNKYYDQITSIDVRTYLVPAPSSTQSSNDPTVTTAQSIDMVTYCRELNRLLDGFFMNCMSALDTLAHELSILYKLQNRRGNMYIKTMKGKLLTQQPNSETGKLLDNELGRQWFRDFEPFRHCTTHESLIHYEMNVPFDPLTYQYRSPRVKLPDNPQARPFTYVKNRIATQYCKATFRRVHSLVDKTYRCVLKDASKCNNVFPMIVP